MHIDYINYIWPRRVYHLLYSIVFIIIDLVTPVVSFTNRDLQNQREDCAMDKLSHTRERM